MSGGFQQQQPANNNEEIKQMFA